VLFRGWQTTQGNINMSRYAILPAGKYGHEARVVVAYDYRVDGRQYEGDRISFGPPIKLDKHDTSDALPHRLYPPTSRVTVYYDPANPSIAVLDAAAVLNGTGVRTFFLVALALALTCLYKCMRHAATMARRILARLRGHS